MLFVNNTSDTARRAAADRAISSSLGLGEATGSTGAKAKQKKAHGALLAARRGDVKTVAVKGNYNKGSYDFDGEMGAPVSICGLGQQIKDGTVLERDLYKTKVDDDGNTVPKHGIPRSTMLHWIKDDDLRRKELKFDRGVQGQPHWYVEKFQRGRTALKSSSTVLGAAETRIAHHPIQRKQEGRAVPTAGVETILRNTAIELNAKNPSTKEFYDDKSDVRRLRKNFVRRTEERFGVVLNERKGQGCSRQRAECSDMSTIAVFQESVIRPALKRFQEEHGPLALHDVGNWDETFWDLCAFAVMGQLYLCPDDGISVNIIIPFEAGPHITFLIGYVGPVLLRVLAVIKGAPGLHPHAFHLQLLKDKTKFGLAQSSNGWITVDLKYYGVEQWIADANNQLGEKASVMCFDGHGSNHNVRNAASTTIEHSRTDPRRTGDDATRAENEMVTTLMRRNKMLGIETPAHTSHEGTQSLDLPDGFIDRFKKSNNRLLQKQFHASLERKGQNKGRIYTSQILAIAELALEEAWSPLKAVRDNERIGFYINDGGLLDYDLISRMDRAKLDVSGLFSPQDSGACSRSGFDRSEKAARVEAGKRKMEIEMQAAGISIERASAPVVPQPTLTIPKGTTSRNQYGAIVTEKEFEQTTESLAAAAAQKVLTAEQKAAKELVKWEKHRASIRGAEAALRAAKNSPSKLKVNDLKALIRGRTGAPPRAKNNKVPMELPPGERKEGTLVSEARSILCRALMLPPTPEKAPHDSDKSEDDDSDGDGDDDDHAHAAGESDDDERNSGDGDDAYGDGNGEPGEMEVDSDAPRAIRHSPRLC